MYTAQIWFVLHLGFLWGSSCCPLSTGFFCGSLLHQSTVPLSGCVGMFRVWCMPKCWGSSIPPQVLVCSGFDVCHVDVGASYHIDLVHIVSGVFCLGLLFQSASLWWNFMQFSGHILFLSGLFSTPYFAYFYMAYHPTHWSFPTIIL